MLFPNLKQVHIKYLAATIAAFGHAIIHGSGQIFTDDPAMDEKHQPSYLHKTLSNPALRGASYCVRFDKKSKLPKTVEQLEAMLLENKNVEENNALKQELTPEQKTIRVSKENEPIELDFSENLEK